MKTQILSNEIELLPEKALKLTVSNILIIADLHLGKIEHFRLSGINLPASAASQTEERLSKLIVKHQPSRVIFLGDLFHSIKNHSFNSFQTLLKSFDNITFDLVIGNHDIMSSENYADLGLNVTEEIYINGLWLTHEPQDEIKEGNYNIAGHIHPGVRLKGKGRQYLTLPCFYFGAHSGLIPAFGYFTGKAIVKIDKKSNIFAIAEDKIFCIDTK